MCGFKFTYIKDHEFQQLVDFECKYQIICTPPIGLITNFPFKCQVVNTKLWCESGIDIQVEISLGAINNKYYDGSPVYQATEYMGYTRKTFKTNKEIIAEFEKILASKEKVLASETEYKIVEAVLHKESECCLNRICTLSSKTGNPMSYYLEAYRGNKEKIIKVIKKALKQFCLTDQLSILLNFPTPVIFITREYIEMYSDVLTVHFRNAINTLIVLSNNRLALAFDNGVVGVYDIITKTIILNKMHKNVGSSLCQLYENTIVIGYFDLDKLMMWNFKHNTEKMINLPVKEYCKNDSIILLEENILMYNSIADNLYVINFNYKKAKINKVDFNAKCFLRDNDKLFMGYGSAVEEAESVHAKNQIAIYNVKDYIDVNLNGKCSNVFSFSKNIKQIERMSKNKIFCLTSFFDGHCCSYFCKIYIMNIKTNTMTVLIEEQEVDNIIFIAYLGNNHLALHRYNIIEIIDILTKKMVRQINTDKKMTLMTKINNKLVVVDSSDYPVPRKTNNKSCVRIYQKI